jgi:TetR/AcrR family transcriptional repressor of nem operon
LIKSQLELAETAQPLYQKASEHMADTEALFYSYLTKTMPAELAKVRTTSLMLHIYGIRAYSYQNNNKQEMIACLKSGLRWLDWERYE